MKKAFLFAFSEAAGPAATVKDMINSLPTVVNWRYDMNYCMYLISEDTADNIATQIRERIPGVRFIVAEINSSAAMTQGWVTPESWHLIKNKANMPPRA